MDPRDAENNFPSKWWDTFDPKTMTVTVELYEDDSDISSIEKVKCHYDVCPLCEGRGKHVNPSIDAHGIGGHEFDEDPDFARDYHRGVYDVPCYRCKGKRVVPVPCEAQNDPDTIRRVREHLSEIAEMHAEMAWESRYGY